MLLPLMPTPLLGHGQRQNGRLGPRKSLVSPAHASLCQRGRCPLASRCKVDAARDHSTVLKWHSASCAVQPILVRPVIERHSQRQRSVRQRQSLPSGRRRSWRILQGTPLLPPCKFHPSTPHRTALDAAAVACVGLLFCLWPPFECHSATFLNTSFPQIQITTPPAVRLAFVCLFLFLLTHFPFPRLFRIDTHDSRLFATHTNHSLVNVFRYFAWM